MDVAEMDSPSGKILSAVGGHRVATVLLYLSDVEEVWTSWLYENFMTYLAIDVSSFDCVHVTTKSIKCLNSNPILK